MGCKHQDNMIYCVFFLVRLLFSFNSNFIFNKTPCIFLFFSKTPYCHNIRSFMDIFILVIYFKKSIKVYSSPFASFRHLPFGSTWQEFGCGFGCNIVSILLCARHCMEQFHDLLSSSLTLCLLTLDTVTGDIREKTFEQMQNSKNVIDCL